jgi:hypothetical protein
MPDLDDINKAEEKINMLFALRDTLQKASPYLNNIKANLEWYKKVCFTIPEQQEYILSLLEDPIKSTLVLEPNVFSLGLVTGITGSYFAASGDTRVAIQSYGNKYYSLISEYDEINKTETLIDHINAILESFREDLQKFNPQGLLHEAKNSYSEWKAGAISNSDLAKDIRAFQDILNGLLHKARVSTYHPSLKTNPEFSWNKMTEALAKEGNGCLKSLRKQQKVNERLHQAFTEIMKGTKEVNDVEMCRIFKDYIEHVYSILNLIDEKYFK